MIYLYADVLNRVGGIETYLHTLALHLHQNQIPVRVAVAELEPCPLLAELAALGISVYRQRRVWGDRWLVRQCLLMAWLFKQLQPGDWVYCVRQPLSPLYLSLVRLVHLRQAKLAASWMLAPEFLPPVRPQFCQAIAETDAVISVSQTTAGQFQTIYGYSGVVHVVPYHNPLLFTQVVPLPAAPPWKIGYMGRLDLYQKNLDILLHAFATVSRSQPEVQLHLYGGGADRAPLERLAIPLGIRDRVIFHGTYDHRHELPAIVANCHYFVYPSRFEGGPCFTLLEIMQAGRFCVATAVGGIPDLYAGYPQVGRLVYPNDLDALATALAETLEWLQNGKIEGHQIRDRYFQGFDITAAHQAWKLALEIQE